VPSFALEVGKDFNPIPEKSVFDNLFEEYEKVIFTSIITAFGLDMFIKDNDGGDVDTIHNVRSGMAYKNLENAAEYENRGKFNSANYYSDKRYSDTVATARKVYRETGKGVDDAYAGGELGFSGKSKNRPTEKNATLDHVIPKKEIHDDPGRVLANLNGIDLANSPENLKFTNEL
jgi:hypothetical protein